MFSCSCSCSCPCLLMMVSHQSSRCSCGMRQKLLCELTCFALSLVDSDGVATNKFAVVTRSSLFSSLLFFSLRLFSSLLVSSHTPPSRSRKNPLWYQSLTNLLLILMRSLLHPLAGCLQPAHRFTISRFAREVSLQLSSADLDLHLLLHQSGVWCVLG